MEAAGFNRISQCIPGTDQLNSSVKTDQFLAGIKSPATCKNMAIRKQLPLSKKREEENDSIGEKEMREKDRRKRKRKTIQRFRVPSVFKFSLSID